MTLSDPQVTLRRREARSAVVSAADSGPAGATAAVSTSRRLRPRGCLARLAWRQNAADARLSDFLSLELYLKFYIRSNVITVVCVCGGGRGGAGLAWMFTVHCLVPLAVQLNTRIESGPAAAGYRRGPT